MSAHDPLNKVIDEWVNQALFYEHNILEHHIRLLLKPKPQLMPEWLWFKLVAKFIIIEEKTTQGTRLAS